MSRRTIGVALWIVLAAAFAQAASLPSPPPSWRMELVAKAPEIRHPSVVCVAPDGRVFVAEDPMDISTPHADAAEGRILCFHPDGHRTVFAEKLHAVFGMQYLEGKLYVLHNPQFSVFQDDDGVGKNREELVETMNPNPWALDWNDHVPANFRLAMDGYLYIATGDKGIYGAVGRDGKRLDLHGGGVIRMRPDGTDLQVYCTGTRNILDVALNDEDEIFTYDNTDEHDWMGRLTHMVDGGFYGYPYDFVPRRPYTLWMMHDFGGGAATDVLCYNEDALPPEYRGNLFLGDFGKQQVLRVRIASDGATYRVADSEEFFKNQPLDFRPVGIAFGADGASLYVCDWQHRDTKENVEVGRLWKATWTGPNSAAPKPGWYLNAAMGKPFEATSAELLSALDHPSKAVRLEAQQWLARRKEVKLLAGLVRNSSASPRSRWHAIWALDACDNGKAAREAIRAAAMDADDSVRRQAIRALGSRGVKEATSIFLAHLSDPDPGVRFQAATALGKTGSPREVPALLARLEAKDLFERFAVFTALNRIGKRNPAAWKSIARGLASPSPAINEGAKFALRETYDPTLLEVLVDLATSRRQNFLTRYLALRLVIDLHHTLPEWKGEWWAYHPALAPPAEKTAAWAGTPRVIALLRRTLTDSDLRVRLVSVKGLVTAGGSAHAGEVQALLQRESSQPVRRAMVDALGEWKVAAFAPTLARMLSETSDAEMRSAQLRAAGRIGGEELIAALIQLATTDSSNTENRAEAVAVLGELKARQALSPLEPLLHDSQPLVRAAAVRAIAQIGGADALPVLIPLMANGPADLRREAVSAVGDLRERKAVPDLMVAWHSPETHKEALEALARISDPRALDAYLEGLANPNPILREACRKAMGDFRAQVLPEVEARVETLGALALGELREIYKGHEQAEHGILFSARFATPGLEDYEWYGLQHGGNPVLGQRIFFDETSVACIKCHSVGGHGGTVGPDLTLIGAQFPRRDLIEHVLYPSRVVREGYQQMLIDRKDGESVSGIVKSETADLLSLVDAGGNLVSIPKSAILTRSKSSLSLMPEGLQAGLSQAQFSDLLAYLESRRTDPRQPVSEPLPAGFISLISDPDLRDWRELPAGTKTVMSQDETSKPGETPAHWKLVRGTLEHDGSGGDLWTRKGFGNFELQLDWRWSDKPVWENFPVINSDGLEATNAQGKTVTERVLDAGDSGVLLRGLYKAQANLFCYPIGSGEFWEYRTDPALTAEQRRAVTPLKNADRPIGDWNHMEIMVRHDRLTVLLNGSTVIKEAQLPGLPERGPIGLQHEHGKIQFANIVIRELRDTQSPP